MAKKAVSYLNLYFIAIAIIKPRALESLTYLFEINIARKYLFHYQFTSYQLRCCVKANEHTPLYECQALATNQPPQCHCHICHFKINIMISAKNCHLYIV